MRFSNPSAPGRLVVQVAMGNVNIDGTDAPDVTIASESVARHSADVRPDGLRRLDSDDGFSVSESDNVVTVSLGEPFSAGRHSADLTVRVPRSTAVSIERAGSGDTVVKDVAGDAEIRGAAGDIRLEGVSGGVLVESGMGDIDASFATLPEQKPVSITVVRGDVTLRVPARAKAGVRFRTLRGEVLTDFAESELQTRFENNAAGTASANANVNEIQVRVAVGQEKVAREHERVVRAAEAAAAEAAAAAVVGAAPGPKPSTGIKIPKPPRQPNQPNQPNMPVLPPMSGGKMVVGTLNGGGPELSVTVVTGSITLRKAQ